MPSRLPYMATCLVASLGAAAVFANSNDVNSDVEVRIKQLCDAMTLEEKVRLLYGATYMDLHAIERLDIPPLALADGPLGIRWGVSTAFPASLALGATWDLDLAHRFGVAIGHEYRNQGRRMWLGPCVGLVRVPHGGRNFESFGEDTHLNSRFAVATIEGAQSQDLIACVKHYACNNQDYERFTIDIQVDERTLHELYLPVFKAAVQEAGVWSVMSAYNQVNGHYCTASNYLQNEVLKARWGFRGFVVSDWGAVHDTVGPANAGLDLEMDLEQPVGKYWGHGKLLEAVKAGDVTESTIDDKVQRILRAMASVGALDDQWEPQRRKLPASRTLAREIARDGIVLLKNERDLLPLDANQQQTIAVIGPNHLEGRTGGGGSSRVTPPYAIGPLEGLREAASDRVKFAAMHGVMPAGEAPPAVDGTWLSPPTGDGTGLRGEYFANRELQGEPVLTRRDAMVNFRWSHESPGPGLPGDGFSVRWTGFITPPATGEYYVGASSDDGARLTFDGERVIDDWSDHALRRNERKLQLEGGRRYPIVLEYYENGGEAAVVLSCRPATNDFEAAVAAARDADAVILCVGLSAAVEGEGGDRESMDLDAEQQRLLEAVTAANQNTIVVIIAGSQVGMTPWGDDAAAVLQAWYPGQEGGHAIADLVFGKHSPSAKLPMTFIRNWKDHPCYGHYPGNVYREGLFMGYRHFDKHDVEPLFPFGFGLSYTTFELSDLQCKVTDDGGAEVTLRVRNTGERAGAEVVQCYVRDVESSVVQPVQALKSFAKVMLQPGEQRQVKLSLPPTAFAFYDAEQDQWRVEPGAFELRVGTSSRDLPLREVVSVDANRLAANAP